MNDTKITGSLSVVSTPIGNLEDVTIRAVNVLKAADLIAAEDTRRARKLLKRYDISSPVTCYNKDNERRKTMPLVQQVITGKHIVLLADSGTPCLADPGYLLVRESIAAGIEPSVIPGPSALTHAIVACGLPVSTFYFAGFLTRKKEKRKHQLRDIATKCRTFFLFESPHRLEQVIRDIVDVLGPESRMVIIREATKIFEERIRGTAGELLEEFAGKKWKGEITIAVTSSPSMVEDSQNAVSARRDRSPAGNQAIVDHNQNTTAPPR